MDILSNVIGDSNEETNFPLKLSLAGTQVSRLPKAFANSSSANTKLLKIQLSKIVQSGVILGELIQGVGEALLMAGLEELELETKVVIKRSPLIAKNAAVYYANKKLKEFNRQFRSGKFNLGITLTNNELKDIIKVTKSLENRGILLKETAEKIINQEGGILSSLRAAGLPLVKKCTQTTR